MHTHTHTHTHSLTHSLTQRLIIHILHQCWVHTYYFIWQGNRILSKDFKVKTTQAKENKHATDTAKQNMHGTDTVTMLHTNIKVRAVSSHVICSIQNNLNTSQDIWFKTNPDWSRNLRITTKFRMK